MLYPYTNAGYRGLGNLQEEIDTPHRAKNNLSEVSGSLAGSMQLFLVK